IESQKTARSVRETALSRTRSSLSQRAKRQLRELGPSDRPIRVGRVIRLFPNHGGWLEVVCGPMFSGKSEELIRRLRRAEIAGQRALILKPEIDSRYDVGHVVSHAGARMRAVTAATSADVPRLAQGYDAVGIDEV